MIIRITTKEFTLFFQDTCTGFLLGGVGELDKHRRPNFLVVDASEFIKQLVYVILCMLCNESVDFCFLLCLPCVIRNSHFHIH